MIIVAQVASAGRAITVDVMNHGAADVPHDLQRFVDAQDFADTYLEAVNELRQVPHQFVVEVPS